MGSGCSTAKRVVRRITKRVVSRVVNFCEAAGGSGPSLVTLADVFIDCEDSTAGTTLTTGILDNMTTGKHFDGGDATGRPLGSWSIIGSTPANLKVSSDAKAPLVPIQVNGTDYATAGTRGIEIEYQDPSHYLQFDYNTTYDSHSIGFWFKVEDGSDPFVNVDAVLIDSSDDFCVFQTRGTAFRLHTNLGTSSDISAAYSTWYWVTMEAVAGGTCSLSVYSEAGSLIGSETLGTTGSAPWRELRMGRTDSHTDTFSAASMYFDSIALDFEDATFPLGVTGSDTPVDPTGYLMRERFDGNARPIGFTVAGGTPGWGDTTPPAPIEGAASVRLPTTSTDLVYDLTTAYDDIYIYVRFNAISKSSFNRVVEFSNPVFTDFLALAWTSSASPTQLTFSQGGASGTTNVPIATDHHLWMEREAGSAARFYHSTDGVKPTAQIDDTTGITSDQVRFIHLLGGGESVHDDLIIHTSPIGSNP